MFVLQLIIKKEFKGSKINVKDFDCKQYATLKQSDGLSEINIPKKTKF